MTVYAQDAVTIEVLGVRGYSGEVRLRITLSGGKVIDRWYSVRDRQLLSLATVSRWSVDLAPEAVATPAIRMIYGCNHVTHVANGDPMPPTCPLCVTEPKSWAEEACSHCKGYKDATSHCLCSPEALEARAARKRATESLDRYCWAHQRTFAITKGCDECRRVGWCPYYGRDCAC